MSATNLVSFLFSRPNTALFQDQYFDKQPSPVTKRNDPRTPEGIARSILLFTENEYRRYALLLPGQQNDPLILIDFSSVQKAKSFWESLQRKAEYTFIAFGGIGVGIVVWRIWRNLSNQPLSNAANQITRAAALASVCFALYVKIRSTEIVEPLRLFPKDMNRYASQVNEFRKELFNKGLQKYEEAYPSFREFLDLVHVDDLLTEKEKAFLIKKHLSENKAKILKDLPKQPEEWQKILPGLDVIFNQTFTEQHDTAFCKLFTNLFGQISAKIEEAIIRAYNDAIEIAAAQKISDLPFCELTARVKYREFLPKLLPDLQTQIKEMFDSIPLDTVTEAKQWFVNQVQGLNDGPAKKFLTDCLQLDSITDDKPSNDVFL